MRFSLDAEIPQLLRDDNSENSCLLEECVLLTRAARGIYILIFDGKIPEKSSDESAD